MSTRLKYVSEQHIISNVNPYATTYGSFLLKDNTTKQYFEFVSSHANIDSLSYGIDYTKDIHCVLVLGKDTAEKNLPVIDYPLTITGSNTEHYIIIDLRLYASENTIKNVNSLYATNLEEHFPRQSIETVKLLIQMGKIMAALYDGDYRAIDPIFVTYLKAITHYVSTGYGRIIKPVGQNRLELIMVMSLYYYFLSSNRDPLKLDYNLVKDVMLRTKLIPKFLFTDDLFENAYGCYMLRIQNLLPEDLRKFKVLEDVVTDCIDGDYASKFKLASLAEVGSKDWFGFGKTYTPAVCLENLPLFLVMMLGIFNTNSFRDCGFSRIMTGVKSNLDLNDFIKYMNSNFDIRN